RRATLEQRVEPLPGKAVPFGDGGAKAERIDAAGFGEVLDGVGLHEIAVAQPRPQRQRRGPRDAKAVAALEGHGADQPAFGTLAARLFEESGNVVMVAHALVAEALAISRHRDDAGLAALDDVREHALRA